MKNQTKPLIVIIKGNERYILRPEIIEMADKFYNDVKFKLELKGYRVEFGRSIDYAEYDKSAVYWIGHSRGCGAFEFVHSDLYPEIKRICLETKSNDWWDKKHYELSEKDKRHLEKIPKVVSSFSEKKLLAITKPVDQLSLKEASELSKVVNESIDYEKKNGYNPERGDLSLRTAVIYEGKVVGYFQPRKGDYYWRSGYVYLGKDYRGKGIMFEALRDFFKDHNPAKAWIANNNLPSQHLFERLGFKKAQAFNLSKKEEDQGWWWVLDDPHAKFRSGW